MDDKDKILVSLKAPNNTSIAVRNALITLWSTSDFAKKHTRIITQILDSDALHQTWNHARYRKDLQQLSDDQTHLSFGKQLRYFRHFHILRLWLRELAGVASTQETMECWSRCAQEIIVCALHFCEMELSARYGYPKNSAGKPSKISVIAMGKLGGDELNFSSDIDLIFVYSEGGETTGPSRIDNQQYFAMLVKRFIQLLQENRAEGFVFRVDLRLRPFGESGPLAISKAALEAYYQEQGRDWERYAMVKAKVLGAQSSWFAAFITPFVYRRYIDYSVIESLRSMKSMIERELQQNPRLNDIKRGKGGIREIEFIVQNVQLIRGGRIPHIQQRNAITAIRTLAKYDLLDRAKVLEQAYLFYRKLENALQIQNDEQRHHLSNDPTVLYKIGRVMGFDSIDTLQEKINQYQRIISQLFQSVLREAASFEDVNRVLIRQMSDVWLGHVEERMAINWLKTMGFQSTKRCYQLLQGFRHSARVRRLSQTARLRLDRFMVRLLIALSQKTSSDEILLRLIQLLEKIIGRSAYLALLAENPLVLEETIQWFSHSPYISKLLTQHPFLLEVLVDVNAQWLPWSRAQLNTQLEHALALCHDDEQAQERLGEFKLKAVLMVARSELTNTITSVRAGRFLSDLAQVIVENICRLVWRQLSEKYPELAHQSNKFSVVAYGKAGSREMNYNSDLDLVFLHQLPTSLESALNRVTQKIVHLLTVRRQSGTLYEVDTRLRPSGSSGLLVSPLDAFIYYQLHKAWTWEHQALLKARVFYGAASFKRKLAALKREVVCCHYPKEGLRETVLSMRKKMGYSSATPLDIKYMEGGLLDLEFLLQYIVLSEQAVSALQFSNGFSLLQHLHLKEKLNTTQFLCLKEAYQNYHQCLHQRLLQADAKPLNLNVAEVKKRISEVYHQR